MPVTVSITNLAGGTMSVTFFMAISQKVELTDITKPFKSSMAYQTNFTYSLSYLLVGANIKSWNIAPALPLSPTLPSDIASSGVVTIDSSTGLLTVNYNNYVEGVFKLTITQEKLVNGEYVAVSESYDITLIICQTPVIGFPSYQVTVPISGVAPHPIPVSDYVVSLGHGALSWSISPDITGVSMVRGYITVSTNAVYYNNELTVIARNNAGGSTQPIIQLVIAHKPVLILSTISVCVADENEYIHPPFTLQKSVAYTGPLTWSLVNSPTTVSIDQNGQLHLEAGAFVINESVTVRVRNVIGGTEGQDERTIQVTIVRAPVFTIPTLSIEYIG